MVSFCATVLIRLFCCFGVAPPHDCSVEEEEGEGDLQKESPPPLPTPPPPHRHRCHRRRRRCCCRRRRSSSSSSQRHSNSHLCNNAATAAALITATPKSPALQCTLHTCYLPHSFYLLPYNFECTITRCLVPSTIFLLLSGFNVLSLPLFLMSEFPSPPSYLANYNPSYAPFLLHSVLNFSALFEMPFEADAGKIA